MGASSNPPCILIVELGIALQRVQGIPVYLDRLVPFGEKTNSTLAPTQGAGQGAGQGHSDSNFCFMASTAERNH